MYDFLIKKYVERITHDDITKFALKEGITLTDDETDVIYNYIKKDWRTFYYGNPRALIDEMKDVLSEEAYIKVESLYIEAKNKINNKF